MVRPIEYTKEHFDEMCALVSEGMSIRKVLDLGKMPTSRTFYKWLRQYPELNQQYARAKEDRCDFYVDQLVDIADDDTVKTGDQIQKAKLRIDTRKWIACKLHPRNYGDQAVNNITINNKDVDVPNRQDEKQWLENSNK